MRRILDLCRLSGRLGLAAALAALPVSLSSCATASSATAVSKPAGLLPWPAPADWKSETLAFPLDFAPAIRHSGLEELRFAPGFFKTTAPGYFSYAFVWWIEKQPPLSAEALAAELRQYYAGLCGAVGGKKYTFDPARYRVELLPGPDNLTGWDAMAGQADLYDAFTNGQPLSLHLRAYQRECGGQRAVLVLASPQTEPAPIWADLRAVGQAFRCP